MEAKVLCSDYTHYLEMFLMILKGKPTEPAVVGDEDPGWGGGRRRNNY
jgi:hypothetical protein